MPKKISAALVATQIRQAATNFIRRAHSVLVRIEVGGLARVIAKIGRNAPRSLANRVLFIQFVWTVIIYLLVIVAIWFATNLVIESSVRRQGENWVAKLDEIGIPVYATKNPEQLKQSIGYLSSFPEIAQAKYLDENGDKVIAEYTRKGGVIGNFSPLSHEDFKKLGRTETEQRPMVFEKGANSQMRVIAPIWVKSIASDGMINYSLESRPRERIETIGFVEVVVDYSRISSELDRNIFYASTLIAVLMLAAAFVMRITVHWALAPLSELEEPLSRLAAGETNITVTTSGDREIASIGAALNTTINALRERDEALRRMVDHDGLTGLVNRAYFVERLEHEVKRIARSGGCSALFFFDLDRFKNINDTYGHAAGDRLLIQVAKQLNPRIRENDVFARYGGDEFTLLAYNVDQDKIQEIADSFIALMREFTFYEAGDSIKIYFSIGITLLNNATLSAHEYLREADTAVHQAKTQGRNCFRIFERDTQGTVAETGIGWHKRLQEALHNRQVVLYFQQMAGLKGQRERLCEVLLRLPDMEHKGQGKKVISPGAFLSAAERFGMMQEFDSLVIDKAAQVLAERKDPRQVLSINLSEQFFTKEDIPVFLEAVTRAHHIKSTQFVFELSQSYISRNIGKLQEIMALLTQRGYRFAIDDFGADFSAFNYIRAFPVHFLKIDGSLVERIATDKIAKATVHAIVEIAKELHMQTIAKNVGNEAEADMLAALGIDYVQGNFISEPSPKLVIRKHVVTP
jgi:diguanylate cyclase (GGDEF)-like protein